MQAAKAKTVKRPSPQAGKNPGTGDQRALKDGSSKAGPRTVAEPGIGFHFLTRELRSIPMFEAQLLSGTPPESIARNKDLMRMIDTDLKQLQAIEDLYLILKAQPKYKKLEPVWSADTKPVIVLGWLLRKLGALAKGTRWTVDTYQEGKKTRYRFVIFDYFHSQRVPNFELSLPLDFLPYLKKRDQVLHDVIVDTFALVSRGASIPLWDEDRDFSAALNDLLEAGGKKTNYGALGILSRSLPTDTQAEIYSKGYAAQYLKLVKIRRRVVKESDIYEKTAGYKITSERKRRVLNWVFDGVRIARERTKMSQFSFIPNYFAGRENALGPERFYKFVWSEHSGDMVWKRANDRLDRDERKYGKFVPVDFSVAKPGEVLKPIGTRSYPERLCDWLKWGDTLFMGVHRQYFYGNMMHDQRMTPSERMLEYAAQQELKKSKK